MTVVIRSDMICPGLTNSSYPARELRFAQKLRKWFLWWCGGRVLCWRR